MNPRTIPDLASTATSEHHLYDPLMHWPRDAQRQTKVYFLANGMITQAGLLIREFFFDENGDPHSLHRELTVGNFHRFIQYSDAFTYINLSDDTLRESIRRFGTQNEEVSRVFILVRPFVRFLSHLVAFREELPEAAKGWVQEYLAKTDLAIQSLTSGFFAPEDSVLISRMPYASNILSRLPDLEDRALAHLTVLAESELIDDHKVLAYALKDVIISLGDIIAPESPNIYRLMIASMRLMILSGEYGLAHNLSSSFLSNYLLPDNRILPFKIDITALGQLDPSLAPLFSQAIRHFIDSWLYLRVFQPSLADLQHAFSELTQAHLALFAENLSEPTSSDTVSSGAIRDGLSMLVRHSVKSLLIMNPLESEEPTIELSMWGKKRLDSLAEACGEPISSIFVDLRNGIQLESLNGFIESHLISRRVHVDSLVRGLAVIHGNPGAARQLHQLMTDAQFQSTDEMPNLLRLYRDRCTEILVLLQSANQLTFGAKDRDQHILQIRNLLKNLVDDLGAEKLHHSRIMIGLLHQRLGEVLASPAGTN